jgi:hypothetical protein
MIMFELPPISIQFPPNWNWTQGLNDGKGQVVMEGDSPNSGTFRTKSIKISVKKWEVQISGIGGYQVWQSLDSDYAKFERILLRGGTWRTLDDPNGGRTGPNITDPPLKTLVFSSGGETMTFMYFVVTDKGMFLQNDGKSIPVSSGSRPTYIQIRFITALKR